VNCLEKQISFFRSKVLEAFQAKALTVNDKINAVVEFLDEAVIRAKTLVNSF
jgi:hypothetical protein